MCLIYRDNSQGEILRTMSSAIGWGFCLIIIAFICAAFGTDSDICVARAGLFPADPTMLWSQVRSLSRLSPSSADSRNIHGIFVPGECYPIAGAVLGSAYNTVEGLVFDVIVIVTGSENIQGISFSSANRFRTPIGGLAAEMNVITRIADKFPFTALTDNCPGEDFWYQVPFVQFALGSPKMISIEIGKVSFDKITAFADELISSLREKRTLLIGVSELASDENLITVNRLDKKGLEMISILDAQGLLESCAKGEARVGCVEAVVLSIVLAKKLGAMKGKILQHTATSGLPRRMRKGIAAVVWSAGENVQVEHTELKPNEGMILWDIAACIITGNELETEIPRNLHELNAGVFITISSNDILIAQAGDLFTTINLVDAVNKFTRILITPMKVRRLDTSILENATLIISIANPVTGVDLPSPDMGIYIHRDKKVGISLPGQDAELTPRQRMGRTCLRCGLFSKSWCNPETDVHYFVVQSFAGELDMAK